MPCPTRYSLPNMIAVTVRGHWCLAGVAEFIAMPADCRDVGSRICTAVASRSEVFCRASQLAYQTIANSVRASKCRRVTDTHFALAVIAKLSLSRVRTGSIAGNSSCHGFNSPSWPPSPRLGTGRRARGESPTGPKRSGLNERTGRQYCAHVYEQESSE